MIIAFYKEDNLFSFLIVSDFDWGLLKIFSNFEGTGRSENPPIFESSAGLLFCWNNKWITWNDEEYFIDANTNPGFHRGRSLDINSGFKVIF